MDAQIDRLLSRGGVQPPPTRDAGRRCSTISSPGGRRRAGSRSRPFESGTAGGTPTAGRAGGLGLVIGAGRRGSGDALPAHGARVVAGDPAELLP
jgi:hypothetical protein